ncbi:hypothetical protein [Coprothermobacter platensis]|uniref:iron-sulfur cluster-binding protein n=1 Tax=Coprothermobacter platensis TaxID=108819 RepID=UPI00037B29B5|nr:hypothetical protein [Coprothermobacter platensis]
MVNKTFDIQQEDFDTYKLISFGPVDEIPQPGQFYMFCTDYLKKPFSVAFVQENDIFFIIKKAGNFTSNIPSKLRIEGPYGKPFPKPSPNSTLISGGAGIGPICFLAQNLTQSHTVYRWFHGENEERSLRLLDRLPANPHQCTVLPTLVTDILNPSSSPYFACGPRAMLKMVVNKLGMSGFVSMEERMACGFGACYGCVIPTTSGYKRVCKEGPVFQAGDVAWRNL